jgi:hypothetical protein
MEKLVIEVNGVLYECCDGIAEARRRNDNCNEEGKLLAFRNSVEANGDRYVLVRITAFEKCNMSIISIPNNVANISKKCFSECRSLYEIVFESDSNLKKIGSCAFCDSGLKTIRIPSNVENIGNGCFFRDRQLRAVVFESDSKLKEIGNCAFFVSRVERIEIPDQCEILTGNSLLGLNFVTVSDSCKSLMFDDDLLVKIKGYTLIKYFGNSNRVLIKNIVESISGGCFRGRKSFCEVVFESNSQLKEIGDSAFCESRIGVIRIPCSVENIGDGCFCVCSSLCEVVFEFDSQLRKIGSAAFSGSVIRSIRIPSNVESFGHHCFWRCNSLCEVVFESDSRLKEIGDSAFLNSGLKTFRIPSNVEKIGERCFARCESLSEITFVSSPSVGIEAFSDCPLKCVNVVKGVILKYEFPEYCTIHEIDSTENE